ncbi:MAG: hypothetical protein NTU41_14890, partial [Chloroflexi bacterium]|nr:hypothetical protein [Chloroflexota bacterium]
LAARLTGWRIDIKSASMVEEPEAPPLPAEAAAAVAVQEPVAVAEESAVEPVKETAPEEITSAVEAVAAAAQPALKPVPQPAVAAPEPTAAKPAPAPSEAPSRESAPAAGEEAEKTYSVEEILSEIEVATARIQSRYGGVTSAPPLDSKLKRGKKVVPVVDEVPAAKIKPKKAIKRQRIVDEELDLDDTADEALDFAGEDEEHEPTQNP